MQLIPAFLTEKLVNSYDSIKKVITTHSETISFTMANLFILYSIHTALNRYKLKHHQRQILVFGKNTHPQKINKLNNTNQAHEHDSEPYHPTNYSPHIVLKNITTDNEDVQPTSIFTNITNEDKAILFKMFDEWYLQKKNKSINNLITAKFPFLNIDDHETVIVDDYI